MFKKSVPRSGGRRLTLLGLCAALALLALPPASSSAAECYAFTQIDSEHWLWDTNNSDNGAVNNGVWDAFDGYGELRVNANSYAPDDDLACTFDENNAEFYFAPEAGIVAGVDASRKLYVSQTGTGFARWLDILENTTGADIVVDVEYRGDLGSDSDTQIFASEDGDGDEDPGDAWLSTDDAADVGPFHPTDMDDPALALVADGSDAGKREEIDSWGGLVESDGFVAMLYDDVTIPAGGRVIFMHLAAQRVTRAEATAVAQQLAAGGTEVFAQMSAAEGADVVNWNATDFDEDGVANDTDNCLHDANVNQSDVDGDGSGDVCEVDADDDGLSNDVEAAIGTNPANPDTDGDGKRDDVDQCPVTAGSQANGCAGDDAPPAVAFTAPADSASLNPSAPTTLSATASDDRGVAKVVFVDDGRVIGEDATAPYSLGYQPHGEDVGRNTLTAIAVDTAGQTSTAFRAVQVERFDATSLSSSTRPRNDRRAPFRFVTRGRLSLPAALSNADGCRGRVTVTFKAGKKTVSSRRVALRPDCTYRSRVTFRLPRRLNPNRLRVFARHGGSSVLKPERAARRSVRVG